MSDFAEDTDGRNKDQANSSSGEETHAPGAEEAREHVDEPLQFTRGGRMKTVIGICLDESSSMSGARDATIQAFNRFLSEQAAITTDDAYVTLCKFNSFAGTPSPLVPVAHQPHLTTTTYQPNGMTALYDALAHVVGHVEREAADADRVVIVVITDGQENASREMTKDAVRAMVQAKEATGTWTFVYLSASLEAFGDGAAAGIQPGNMAAVSLVTPSEVSMAYGQLSNSLGNYRSSTLTKSSTMSGSASGADWTPQGSFLRPNEVVLTATERKALSDALKKAGS